MPETLAIKAFSLTAVVSHHVVHRRLNPTGPVSSTFLRHDWFTHQGVERLEKEEQIFNIGLSLWWLIVLTKCICGKLHCAVTTATKLNWALDSTAAHLRKHCCGFLDCELIVQTYTLSS